MVALGALPSLQSEHLDSRHAIDVPAAWLRLALHAGEPDFFEKLLALLLAQSSATGGGVWLLVRTARGNGLSFKAASEIPKGDPAWNAWLGERVRELIADRKAMSVPAGPGDFPGPFLFVPLVWEGSGFGVALLNDAAVDLATATRLGVLAGWAMRLHVRPSASSANGHEQACTEALLASAHSAEWPSVLATHLRRQSGGARVSILRQRKNGWQVAAVSGAGEVKRRTAESRAIEQEFARLLASDAGAQVHRERSALSIRFGNASSWGALLEFEKGHVPDEKQVLHGLAGLIQVSERVLPQMHAPGWRSSLARALLAPPRTASPRGSRWALAGIALVAALAACLPVTQTFEGDCELQPAQRFTVVAEVEGRIQSIGVEEGALVAVGQTLATLDASAAKTRLEVARELRQEQEAQARRYQGLQDMTSYRLAKLKAEQYTQEERTLEDDIRRSTIVAPIEGKVLTKDLAQKQGTVLRLGDTLCEVGGLNAWNLQIALPEEDLDAFLQSMRDGPRPVTYRLKAGSAIALSAEISSSRQVSEMAYPVDGRNLIYVTAPGVSIPAELLHDLRPGFSGRAKIEGAKRAWAMILTRHFVQYLRLHWWL